MYNNRIMQSTLKRSTVRVIYFWYYTDSDGLRDYAFDYSLNNAIFKAKKMGAKKVYKRYRVEYNDITPSGYTDIKKAVIYNGWFNKDIIWRYNNINLKSEALIK